MIPRPRQPRALLGLGAAVLLCLQASLARAGETSAFASLRTPTTPEQTAWGGAMAAGSLGPDALCSNPAALARETSFLVAASHRTWQLGLQQEWVGGRAPIGSTWFGLELSAVHAGALEGYDELGISTGSFQPLEIVAGVGAARRIAPSLTLGAAVHGLYLGSSGSGSSLHGWSGDLGARLSVASQEFGLALRHLGPSVSGEQGSYPLPTEIALGGFHPLPAGLELAWTAALGRAEKRQVHGGFRWRPSQALAVLAGGRWSSEERPLRPSAGVEFDLPRVRLAYGFAPDGELGATHQVFLALRIPMRAVPSSPLTEPRAAPTPPPLEPAAPATPTLDAAPRPGDAPAATWSVWGGKHRSLESARAEVRAWRVEGISTGEAVLQSDGTYRVVLLRGLARTEAERLARARGAQASPDAP